MEENELNQYFFKYLQHLSKGYKRLALIDRVRFQIELSELFAWTSARNATEIRESKQIVKECREVLDALDNPNRSRKIQYNSPKMTDRERLNYAADFVRENIHRMFDVWKS